LKTLTVVITLATYDAEWQDPTTDLRYIEWGLYESVAAMGIPYAIINSSMGPTMGLQDPSPDTASQRAWQDAVEALLSSQSALVHQVRDIHGAIYGSFGTQSEAWGWVDVHGTPDLQYVVAGIHTKETPNGR